MKPATKKTLIIMLAIAVVGVIVWLLFFRKKEWEKILDKLDIDAGVKKEIHYLAKQWDSDPEKRKELAAEAADCNETYDRWLILMAAAHLRYPVQTNMLGQLIINPKD